MAAYPALVFYYFAYKIDLRAIINNETITIDCFQAQDLYHGM